MGNGRNMRGEFISCGTTASLLKRLTRTTTGSRNSAAATISGSICPVLPLPCKAMTRSNSVTYTAKYRLSWRGQPAVTASLNRFISRKLPDFLTADTKIKRNIGRLRRERVYRLKKRKTYFQTVLATSGQKPIVKALPVAYPVALPVETKEWYQYRIELMRHNRQA